MLFDFLLLWIRKDRKTILGKVLIKGKGTFDLVLFHNCKAGAVSEAEVFIFILLVYFLGSLLQGFINNDSINYFAFKYLFTSSPYP